MANVTKLSNEELEELKTIQSKYLELTAQLGQVNLEKISLTLALQSIEEELSKLQGVFLELKELESKIQQAFTKKYGIGTVNLESGEFISEV
jgi:division protein CdvB (Snf7/Vps24/ESCRT-III family)